VNPLQPSIRSAGQSFFSLLLVVVPVVVAILDLGLISHIPGRICNHPQYFGPASLHFGYMRFAGASP
jgi:hypothetical protein